MKDHSVERGLRWLCRLAMTTMFYGASFFVVMAIVCRCGIQLSAAQLHVVETVYQPVMKVLPSSVTMKGLQICAGMSEIEWYFFFNHPQTNHWQRRKR